MPKKPTANVTPMIHQIAKAIANADGADLNADPARYRRLALAALKPLRAFKIVGGIVVVGVGSGLTGRGLAWCWCGG
jgi:hypothetical protein